MPLQNKKITLTVVAPRFAGYLDCFLHTPLEFRVENHGTEAIGVRLVAESEEGLIMRYETQAEIPFESAVKLAASDLFSPIFLAKEGEPRPAHITARIECGGRTVCRETVCVTALPYGYWEGLSGNAARLAAFVEPNASLCAQLRREALRRAGISAEGAKVGKEQAVRFMGGLFSALKAFAPERAETNCGAPVSAGGAFFAREPLRLNALEVGILACSSLEGAGLRPLLAVGEKRVAVGVWLYETGLYTGATDDCEVIETYLPALSFFEAEDVFSGGNVSFSASGKKFARALREGQYCAFADIHRCRAEGFCPPAEGERGKQEEGQEGQEGPAVFRGRIWEKRLLDFSSHNPLLDFSAHDHLRVACADADGLIEKLAAAEMSLAAGGAMCEVPVPEEQLIRLETERGVLRAYASEEETVEIAERLMRAGREAETESGAHVLYLALGILRYSAGGKELRAPIVLLPVGLAREGRDGRQRYRLHAEGTFFLNSTLFEFLGLKTGEGVSLGESAFSTVAGAFRAVRQAAGEGSAVEEGAFLGVFSFRNFFLWHDLRTHFAEFCKNETVRALLRGHAEKVVLPAAVPCPALPLEADASQAEAAALADTGASFVLHGPPGTGKSQTIANLIARALGSGKRVLFIAEKKAALDVVMHRLERIGIGDFCLEVNAERTGKTQVACKIEQTLSLSAKKTAEKAGDGAEKAARVLQVLSSEADAADRALHERGYLGCTAVEAVARLLACEDLPELPGAGEGFYRSLTAEKFEACRRMLAEAERLAHACAVRGAPFENTDFPAYSERLKGRVVCACEAVLVACRHLRESLSLLCGFYGQREPALTEERLRSLTALCGRLLGGKDEANCRGLSAGERRAFFAANAALDPLLEGYFKHFRVLVEPADEAALLRYGEEGGDWRLDFTLCDTARRLCRAALFPLDGDDLPKFLKTLSDIEAQTRILRGLPFCSRLFDRRGKLIFSRREALIGPFRTLRAQCGEAFCPFDAEAFSAACDRAAGGAATPILNNFCGAAEGFFAAFDSFLAVTGALREALKGEDVVAYAAQKAAALLENIDLLRSWCRYRETARRLEDEGVGNVTQALSGGKYGAGGIVKALEKGAYRRFLERRAAEAPLVASSSDALEERMDALDAAIEAERAQTCKTLRDFLIQNLPKEGEFSAERARLMRQARGNARGFGLRSLFAETALLARACPCLLMSPSTAAQLLPPQANAYDLVIFDEASQMSTAEAIGCIARAKAAIVVGDPNQLPPTSFFRPHAGEEDEGDGESVLDDFLALGMPERRLLWHYRSRHESLIAFSNAAYYNNTLRTVPPPDAAKSRVKLVRVSGVYDRGGRKSNRAEAEALVSEIVARLSDPARAKMSMGVVTFSVAQKEEIDRLLASALSANGLEEAAYAREEPLFVKNLENVQGDERDVILFSVCYGADERGKLSLNFGPLNRAGGWRRLNVAASRAREEMLVYTSLTAAAIDVQKTSSRGVLGLKAFLEFAETGKTLRDAGDLTHSEGVGGHLARALERLGYACRREVGASSFKVDVAVLDPKDRSRYLLAILFDGCASDGTLLKRKLLRQAGWEVLLVSSVGYYSNSVRELERVKGRLEALTGKRAGRMARYARPYRAFPSGERRPVSFLSDAAGEGEICDRLRAIVACEQPISRAFLKKRCLASFGIASCGKAASARLDHLIDGCGFSKDRVGETDYFYKSPRAIAFSRYRTEGKTPLRHSAEDFTVYEVVSMVKGALEENVALYEDELAALFEREFRAKRADGALAEFLLRCVRYGEEKGLFARSASDRITLK